MGCVCDIWAEMRVYEETYLLLELAELGELETRLTPLSGLAPLSAHLQLELRVCAPLLVERLLEAALLGGGRVRTHPLQLPMRGERLLLALLGCSGRLGGVKEGVNSPNLVVHPA